MWWPRGWKRKGSSASSKPMIVTRCRVISSATRYPKRTSSRRSSRIPKKLKLLKSPTAVAKSPLDVPVGFLFLELLPLVLYVFPLGQSQLNLHFAAFKIKLDRDQCEALFMDAGGESGDLVAV